MRNYKLYFINLYNSLKRLATSIFWIIIFIGIIGLIYVAVSRLTEATRPKFWTLFIYNNEIPDTEKQKARIDGYNNKTTCLEKGLLLTKSGQSFECGYDCKYKKGYYIEVCEKVCNQTYCH